MSDHPPSRILASDFDIGQWLASLHLEQYAPMFAENNISNETLGQLTIDDLKEIGVVSLGHRKTLLVEIQKLFSNRPVATGSSIPRRAVPRAEPQIMAKEPADRAAAPRVSPPPKSVTPLPRPAPSAAPRPPATSPVSVAAPAATADPTAEAPKSRRGFWMKIAASKFLVVSIIVHLLFGMGATYFIVQSIQTKRKLSFQGGPPNPSRSKRALEHKVSMAQKKKTGGAPPQAKRIVSTGLAKVSLPEMPAMPTSTNVVPGMMPGMGGAGFGTGMGFGSGMGSGMGGAGGGGGINFFGLRASGRRIAFLLDYSGSMEGKFREKMEEELEKALKGLSSGSQVILIMWAGPAWLYNQTAHEVLPHWKKGKNYGDFSMLGGEKFKSPPWQSMGTTKVEEIMKGVHAQVSAPGGTDWRQPFRYAMEATPAPDTIFFMTDGQIADTDITLTAIDEALKKSPRPPQVNCLWIKNGGSNDANLKKIATKYNGQCRTVSP